MKWLLIILGSYGSSMTSTSGPWFEDVDSCQRAATYVSTTLAKGIERGGHFTAGCVQGTPAVVPPVNVNVQQTPQPVKVVEPGTNRILLEVKVKHK